MKCDLIIRTEDHSVDMKTGLETLSGASEAVRAIVEAATSDHVTLRNTTSTKFRNTMMESFEGSYGIVFKVDTQDPEQKAKFKAIGKKTMGQVIGYFIAEALYQDTPDIGKKAEAVIDAMSQETQETLLTKLRRSPLNNALSVPSSFGYGVVIKRHIDEHRRQDIFTFDRGSKLNLTPRTDRETLHFRACITRLNINTGNGRLLIQGQTDTVAFGFPSAYREVLMAAKKRFSHNLDINNGRPSDEWEYIDLSAYTLRLKSGQIIKYMISGFA